MNLESPYFVRKITIGDFKRFLLDKLRRMTLPKPVRGHSHEDGACSRDCHIMERNFTIAMVEDLISK